LFNAETQGQTKQAQQFVETVLRVTVYLLPIRLNELFYRYPELGRAWVLKESFRDWYRGTDRSRVIIFTLIDVDLFCKRY